MGYVDITTVEQLKYWQQKDREGVEAWCKDINQTLELVQAKNAFWRERQQEMRKKGLDSPDMIVEARLPLKLFLLKEQGEPGWLDDDASWYSFLRQHRELRTYDYGEKKFF